MTKKTYQRNIRIDGKMIRSPKFQSKLEANLWYQRKYDEKHAAKTGTIGVKHVGPTLGQYFWETWFPKRKKRNPLKSTWGADEQRFLAYVAKELGGHKISKITTEQVKSCLQKVVDVHGRSTKTRDRVRALISKMFRDARNETPQLVVGNPASGIEFDDPRTGKYQPPHLRKMADVVKYFKAAEELSTTHLTYAGLAFFASLRKGELIPLLWQDDDREENLLNINKRLVQASMTIERGTKSGSDEGRMVPVSDALRRILDLHRATAPFKSDSHYILSNESGRWIGPRDISRLNEAICERAGVEINPHGLRHTYGRMFAQASQGNIKALQTILGHSTISVTEIYSTLSGAHLVGLRNVVSLDRGGA